MDTFISFVICTTWAVLILCGTAMAKSNVRVIPSKAVNVTCGGSFNLCCTVNVSNASHVWSRAGTVVKQQDKRYSYNRTNGNDSTNFCILVHVATHIDKGNWTCELQATDTYNGAKSDFISVNVFPHNNGTVCNTSNESTEQVSGDSGTNSSDGHNEYNTLLFLYMHIGVGTACGIILILISIIIYCQCRNRKNQTGQPKERTIPLNVINGPTLNNDPPMSDANNIYQNLIETSKTEKRFFIEVEDKKGDSTPTEVIYSQVVLSRVGSSIHPPEFDRTEYATLSIKRNSVFYDN